MAPDALSDEERQCIVESGRCLLHGASRDASVEQASITDTAHALVGALQSRIAELEAALDEARRALDPHAVTTRPTPPAPAAPTAGGWGDGEATFEELIAAKAFFRHDTVDESSRRWLLDQS